MEAAAFHWTYSEINTAPERIQLQSSAVQASKTLHTFSKATDPCRERKKAKLQSQSKDVEDLTQQMQDFEGLNAGVRAQESRKAALEQDLWAKEAEIERIKCVLHVTMSKPRSTSCHPGLWMNELERHLYGRQGVLGRILSKLSAEPD